MRIISATLMPFEDTFHGNPLYGYYSEAKGHRQVGARWVARGRGAGYRPGMTPPITPSYAGHRFPPKVIGHAVWLYFRFPLGLRMVEELLAARGHRQPRDHSAVGAQVRPGLRERDPPAAAPSRRQVAPGRGPDQDRR